MAKVSSTTELPVSAKTVWAVIGNFNALPDWHPAVEKSELKNKDGGTLRKLSLVGGGTIEEKLSASTTRSAATLTPSSRARCR
jgi:ribosome-associated toxin RatA of RatAB toxin-antitoxin module